MHGSGESAVAADQFKNRKPVLVANYGLAIDQTGANWQLADRHGDKGKAVREVVSVACNQSDAGTIAAGQDAEAVMLDFVNPVRAGRRHLRWRRQTRLNYSQPGAGTLTQRHGRLIGI